MRCIGGRYDDSLITRDKSFCGAVFIFINRSKTMIRALIYERNGFWLCSTRLPQGQFQGWPHGKDLSEVAAADLMQFLMRQVWKKK